MFTINDADISSDELTRRAREEVRRRRLESPPARPRAAGESSQPTAVQWAAVHQAITTAERCALVGTTLPPMHQIRGWRRRIAVPLAKMILRAAALVTREQTSFNVETIRALRVLGETIAQQQRGLEHGQVIAQQEQQAQQAQLDALIADTERQGAAIDERLGALDRSLQDGSSTVRDIDATVRQAVTDLTHLRTQVVLQERRVATLLEASRREPTALAAVAPIELDHLLDAFYVRFEDHFRGTREDIKSRARVHLEPVHAAGAGTAERPILDLACGRGEWVELLRDEGLVARGVDTNRVLVEETHRRGLDVVEADALTHLRSLPDASCGAVTAIHFLEHLPFATMVAFLDEVVRVLQPGGVAIFETPNPKNLVVGASTFYVDPTHRNPIFPDTLAFLAESRGFVRVAIRELHPVDPSLRIPDDGSPLTARLNALLFGPQDFAMIGHRA